MNNINNGSSDPTQSPHGAATVAEQEKEKNEVEQKSMNEEVPLANQSDTAGATAGTGIEWDKALKNVERSINHSIHQTLGMSPFEIITGLPPRNKLGFNDPIIQQQQEAKPKKLIKLRLKVKERPNQSEPITGGTKCLVKNWKKREKLENPYLRKEVIIAEKIGRNP